MPDLKPGQVGSVTDLAVAMEVSRTTVHQWLKKPDFPAAVGGVFSVRLVAEWRLLRDQELERKQSGPAPAVSSGDPLLDSGDSPGLERYRMAKAQLAELDLAERELTLLPVVKVHAGISAICLPLRNSVDQIQRRWPEAAKFLTDGLQESERLINDLFPCFGDVGNEAESNSEG